MVISNEKRGRVIWRPASAAFYLAAGHTASYRWWLQHRVTMRRSRAFRHGVRRCVCVS